MIIPALVAMAVFGPGAQTVGTDLLSPPGKPSPNCKWRFDGKPVKSPAIAGSGTYSVPGGPYGETGVVEMVWVDRPPTSRRLRFTIALRGSSPDQTFAIVFFGYDNKARLTKAEWERIGALHQGSWTQMSCDLSLPPDANHLQVILHNPNKQPIFMSAPHLIAGGPSAPDTAAMARAAQMVASVMKPVKRPANTAFQITADKVASQPGPVVAHILIRAPLCTKKPGEKGLATFPIPAMGNGQVPLAFRLACGSPGHLIAYKWRKRKDGRNLVCDVTVEPGPKGAWVQYDALVLLGGPGRRDTAAPSHGRSGTDWTRKTACVQSAAPEIRAIEQKLQAPGDTDEAYARKVFAFVRDDHGQGAPFKALDALAAVHCGGSCTNKANLVAALLRARGIPARTVSHMPTWYGARFYEHWLTEYWQPGQGWIAIDPMLGRWEPDRRTRVVLSVANPSDEELAFDPLHERFVMPGAPYLSVLELSRTLFPADLTEDDEINSADQVSLMKVGPTEEAALFATAETSFPRLFHRFSVGSADGGRYERILSAAKGGDAAKLAEAIKG